MSIEKVIEIADYLRIKEDVVKLGYLKKLADQGAYNITFWGHFSAGKSYLINNILGKKILPVHNTETTAVLTYVSYSEVEECKIIYDDGKVMTYSIDATEKIFQNSSFVSELEKVNHLEIAVNSEILKSGITIVDTPGVNTVITKHQNLAIDSIEQAGKIIYILGGAPSNIDKEFIEKINSAGIDFIFVRTKCDSIDVHEEDIQETLQNEYSQIKEILKRDVPYIGLSNIKENELFANIEKVREQLKDIAESIQEQMDESIKARLKVYQDKYKDMLENRLTEIKKLSTEDISVLTAKIDLCNDELSTLTNMLNSNQNIVENKLEQAKIKSKKEIENLIGQKKDEYDFAIKNNSILLNEIEIQNITKKKTEDFILCEQSILEFYLDEIISSEKQEIYENIKSISAEDDEIPSYSELQIENSEFLEQYMLRLQEAKLQLEIIIQEHRDLSARGETLEDEYDEEVYAQAIAELQQQLDEIPTDMALKLSENQPVQPSQVLKWVGDAADLALLLIPGDAIVAGAKTVAESTKIGTKIAQVIHKSKKATDVVTKIAKNAKGIDKIRDSAYAVNTILKQRKYSTKKDKELANKLIDKGANALGSQFDKYKTAKKEGTILDMLSVSYWTQKFGEKFDSKPKLEIDKELEEERKNAREIIYNQQQQILNDKIQRRKEIETIKTQQQELEFRQREQQNIINIIEEELRTEDDKLRQNAQKKAYEKYVVECKNYFSECIEIYAKEIMEEYYNAAMQNLSFYISKNNAEVTNRIEDKKNYLQELLELKFSNVEEINNEIKICETFISEIDCYEN